ncbi:MAG: hypothetical protein QG577_2586 [Thermodesulfobacteriota bacterium]|nr:hypothetical protein [Thermodesulfobacteriota bacterium]
MTPLVKERTDVMSEMNTTDPAHVIWIHKASFSYLLERPAGEWQTLWVFRQGWGYMKRRDIWTPLRIDEDDLRKQGFVLLKPGSDPDVHVCKTCGLHMESIPGFLRQKHHALCARNSEEGRKLDEMLIEDQRIKIAEARLRQEELQERLEEEAEQKKERFDEIREETALKQMSRNRRQKLREEAREQLIET